jgi:hypothetical protein
VNDERRQFQRLTLLEPLDAWFGDFSVRLIDLSATGALIESEELIPEEARALLRFFWRGREVELMSETVRVDESRAGLRFDKDDPVLIAILTESAQEVVAALEANARGDRAANVVGDETLTAAWRRHESGFVAWTLTDRGWTAMAMPLPRQPENGFTVPASEHEDQVGILRRTYESGDTEARRMTRMLAELSCAGG